MGVQRLAAVAGILATGSLLSAAERHWVGPRSTAMGGVGIATSADADAVTLNPAALAFLGRATDDRAPLPADGGQAAATRGLPREDDPMPGSHRWGLGVGFQAGLELTERFGDHLDLLADIDNLDLATSANLNADQARQVVEMVGSLVAIDDDDLGFRFDANAGVSVRVGSLAFGGRYWFDAVGSVRDLDLVNIGLADGSELNTALNDPGNAQTIIGQDPSTYTIQTLSPAQQSQLSAYGTNAIKAIDAVLTGQGGLLDPQAIQDAVDALALMPIAGDGSLADNTSSVTMVALAVSEAAIGWGYAFDDRFAVGVTGKLMAGRVYGTRILIFSDENDEVFESLDDEYEDTLTFGIDIAALYRLPQWRFAVTLRDLNSPTFDGFTASDGFEVDDIELEPSLTVGVAWIPLPSLIIEANAELLERDGLLGARANQHAGLGLEWTGLPVLALRAGVATDLAEDDFDPLLSAGIGVDFWVLQIDLAAAVALDTVTYDGEDYPEAWRVAFDIRAEW